MNVLKYSKVYFLISALFVVPSIFSLISFGFKPGIDFTGGALLEVSITDETTEVNEDTINQAISEVTELSLVQPSGEAFLLRGQEISSDTNAAILLALDEAFDEVEEIRFETVGPTLGKELLRKTAFAVLLASGSIMAYMAYRFSELKYGVCGVLAMFHDTIIVAGSFSLLGYFYGIEVDTLFVTAILTTLSFSVHDTIVVYDRIRELLRLHPKAPFEDVVNNAILETLSRSINNSMTIIFMLLALFLLGGETVRWFVFALLIGTITGTYSSTFTAAPLVVLWEKIASKK